ncbi:hypothetical protein Herbaro_06030 [Herbaspirillum sp. WKF16]|uniref:hypothetical protein n=1 Tax=Herbaspirillum sp. WKF16 TaxID=3028312 RepID=UPI0023A962C1|nr:hypothetical protein [Herbaspirillum sp. WKF16]WDZ97346.1 hypothetical protein Herbaro_06030 [Herbaspirillum sp. WKF16]
MDIQQLKLLAKSLRELFERNSARPLGHEKSLNLIAAVPGLRNWSVVSKSPDKVLACQFDESAANRLARRIEMDIGPPAFSPELLLKTLRATTSPALKVWPSGPAPGIYLTPSPDAISALLDNFDTGTEGSLIYTEQATGHQRPLVIGEEGIWSEALLKAPSGTLLVLGCFHLNQDEWSLHAGKLERARILVERHGYRIAILLNTPSARTMYDDVLLLLDHTSVVANTLFTGVFGQVTEMGELSAYSERARKEVAPQLVSLPPSEPAIPKAIIAALAPALQDCHKGLIVLGVPRINRFDALEVAADILRMTDHVGPAARVPGRPGLVLGSDGVPESIRRLPLFPSVESAHAQGYKRIVFETLFTARQTIAKYSEDCLLIGYAIGASFIDDIIVRIVSPTIDDTDMALIENVIALGTISNIDDFNRELGIGDLFIKSRNPATSVSIEMEDGFEYGDVLQETLGTQRLCQLIFKSKLALESHVQLLHLIASQVITAEKWFAIAEAADFPENFLERLKRQYDEARSQEGRRKISQ